MNKAELLHVSINALAPQNRRHPVYPERSKNHRSLMHFKQWLEAQVKVRE